jgi:signal peptidase I
MLDNTIQWFRNNWFLWVILILVYITIRAFGYDIKVVESSNNIANIRLGPDDF